MLRHWIEDASAALRRRPGLVLFALCFAAYLSNFRSVHVSVGGDTIPNRLIPFAILRDGTVELDAWQARLYHPSRPFYIQEKRGARVSLYPIGTSFGALPIYVPVYAFLAVGGRPSHDLLFDISEPTEKLAAVAITAFAVWIFWLTVRRRLAPRQAFCASVAFGVGSSMWATASQMLWQQTVVAAAVTVALCLLTWPGFPRWAAAGAGAALSLAVATRPPAGLFFLAGLVATIALARRSWLGHAFTFCAAGVPLVALSCGINWYYYGHPAGFYSGFLGPALSTMFAKVGLRGIAGLIISPNRGLLIFTPIALLGILGLARQLVTRKGRDPVLLSFGMASLLHLLLCGAYREWWGGFSFGPRYLVDILPILALAGADLWNRLPAWARRMAIAGLVWSVLVQINGAFCYPASNWNARMLAEQPAAAAWNWSEFALWQDFRAWLELGTWSAPY